MKIGFFAQGEGPHLDIAQKLIDSAKAVMPGVEIYQLTDDKTPALATPIRATGNMPMGVRRLVHYAQLPGDWLFVDTDIVFQKDVRDVFDKPFDVAVASRAETYMARTHIEYSHIMPYNFGVIFSRNVFVWRTIIPQLLQLNDKIQRWGGEQFLLGRMASDNKLFNFHILPSSYNYPPEQEGEDLSHAHIVHFKGKRKNFKECTT